MFNEANAVENFIRDILAGPAALGISEPAASYGGGPIKRAAKGLGWVFVAGPNLPRKTTDVLIESHLREALIRLNREIAEVPDRADEVIYRLRAIIFSVGADGLVKANEEFTAWLRGERSMPFGENNSHVQVRLIDEAGRLNNLVVSTQVTFEMGLAKRFDLVLFVNGMPLVVGECKTPSRPSVSWVDGADDVHNDYELTVPAFFVPNVFSFATEGKTYRYGSIRQPIDDWAPWRLDKESAGLSGMSEMQDAVRSMLRPEVVLDLMSNFTVFATDRRRRRIKIICRFQQYHAVNGILERVKENRIKKGLIWHFQGSGKSLLMVFSAQKLRKDPELKAPTVIIVVDRIDLDTQITSTFNATDVPNVEPADNRAKLEDMLRSDTRKVIITTIHKFGEAEGVLNERGNIICLVDECHRTQEGDLGRKMRAALPNAFLFGLTGTPINKRDRNTFWAFGADEDQSGYMSRYRFDESIRDRATLPLHFEPRLVELRIDRSIIDEEFKKMTTGLSDGDRATLSREAGKMARLLKAPNRTKAVVADIVHHFTKKVEPNGFKAQVVAYDQEACILFKEALDELLPPESSEVVISVPQGEIDGPYSRFRRDRDAEEKVLDRFRDPHDPLKILVVTAKLLTGFDAPILQCQYLDKPMKEHTLLQAICRTNRPYPGKSHGLIVDYLGVFDDVAAALGFDEEGMKKVVTNISELADQLHDYVAKCLSFFPDVDRTVGGYEGLITAQECVPTNELRDAFAAAFGALTQCWEAVSPDPILDRYESDYRWLAQVYESIKPPSGNGKLLWHRLGAKTVELIHENVHVEAIHDDLESLVLDPDVLSSLLHDPDPKKTKEIEIKITERLRRHGDHPRFKALGERLEELRLKAMQGLIQSIDFLKGLLQIAKETVESEQELAAVDPGEQAREALTELFQSVRDAKTPVIVERIVANIDDIVRQVRFPGWQATNGGEREVKQALRRTLLKYQLHHDNDLFDRAYGYIKTYYAM